MSTLTVVEVSSGVAGAFAGRLLATLGANVIKVEAPRRGDATRHWGPFADDVPHLEYSLLFQNLNLNKRGITLDVESLDGFEVLQQILRNSDILLLEDEEQWSDDRIDLLHKDFPSLVIGLMRPFGRSGPNRGLWASGLNLFEAGGSGYLNPAGRAYFEHPARQPLNLPGHTSEKYWGLIAAMGILAAVLARPENGGQIVDCSGQEAHLSISRQQISYYANDQLYETRETYHTAFAGCVPCMDGYVEMYIMSNPQWEGLLNMMDNPEWAKDERFSTPVGRIETGPEIDGHLFEWARSLSKKEIYRRAQRFGVPVGYFATPAEVVSIPQEQARQFFQVTTHPSIGSIPFPFTYALFSGTPAKLTNAAPMLGQHNREVFIDFAGLDGTDLTTLSRLGVI